MLSLHQLGSPSEEHSHTVIVMLMIWQTSEGGAAGKAMDLEHGVPGDSVFCEL